MSSSINIFCKQNHFISVFIQYNIYESTSYTDTRADLNSQQWADLTTTVKAITPDRLLFFVCAKQIILKPVITSSTNLDSHECIRDPVSIAPYPVSRNKFSISLLISCCVFIYTCTKIRVC